MPVFRFKFLLMIYFLIHACISFAEDKNDFVLGAGDSIHITVFQNPDLTLDTRMPESGNITYPLIGLVNIGGLTIADAERKIARALKDGGFFQQPQVNIVLVTPGNQISILGQVSRPGRYALDTPKMRISDALALAGGASPTGSDTAVVIGTRENKPFRKVIDIASIFLDDKQDDNIQVIAGDEIYVHRPPVFYIYGEVQRPGSYRVERSMTVIQALAEGGGPTTRGTQRSIKLYRRNSAGEVVESTPSITQPIQADDVLYVRESLF
ncbi:polysaccharide export protein EpsE [Methyloradius palustris]|uniref:Polysaccharide export protein EpsE n=1 Tax=Methyloradius palustris TaxID=2778876 RepID=A0A8D5JXZ8_9PROT|nr:polysaccharide export protein EpsE [Methyloradius palustris]BCM24237.1 hypothetical protein ZMTM_04960 [Methyloradius palustris]